MTSNDSVYGNFLGPNTMVAFASSPAYCGWSEFAADGLGGLSVTGGDFFPARMNSRKAALKFPNSGSLIRKFLTRWRLDNSSSCSVSSPELSLSYTTMSPGRCWRYVITTSSLLDFTDILLSF